MSLANCYVLRPFGRRSAAFLFYFFLFSPTWFFSITIPHKENFITTCCSFHVCLACRSDKFCHKPLCSSCDAGESRDQNWHHFANFAGRKSHFVISRYNVNAIYRSALGFFFLPPSLPSLPFFLFNISIQRTLLSGAEAQCLSAQTMRGFGGRRKCYCQ